MRFATDIFTITPELVIVGWFIIFILTHEVNLSFRLKKFVGLDPTEYIKLIDCPPCLTWWFTLIISLEPATAATAYLIAILIDKLES